MSAAPDQTQRQQIDRLAELEAALDALIERPQRTLRVFDRCLGRAWNTPRRYSALRTFLLRKRSNRVLIVVHDATTLARDCPRLLTALRTFSHAMSIHETESQAKRAYDPFAIADERDYLHRFHYDAPRALLATDDAPGASDLVRRFEEIWEASAPAVSATTLGL